MAPPVGSEYRTASEQQMVAKIFLNCPNINLWKPLEDMRLGGLISSWGVLVFVLKQLGMQLKLRKIFIFVFEIPFNSLLISKLIFSDLETSWIICYYEFYLLQKSFFINCIYQIVLLMSQQPCISLRPFSI